MATSGNIKSYVMVAVVTAQLSKPDEVCVTVVITSLLVICLFRQQAKDIVIFKHLFLICILGF